MLVQDILEAILSMIDERVSKQKLQTVYAENGQGQG